MRAERGTAGFALRPPGAGPSIGGFPRHGRFRTVLMRPQRGSAPNLAAPSRARGSVRNPPHAGNRSRCAHASSRAAGEVGEARTACRVRRRRWLRRATERWEWTSPRLARVRAVVCARWCRLRCGRSKVAARRGGPGHDGDGAGSRSIPSRESVTGAPWNTLHRSTDEPVVPSTIRDVSGRSTWFTRAEDATQTAIREDVHVAPERSLPSQVSSSWRRSCPQPSFRPRTRRITRSSCASTGTRGACSLRRNVTSLTTHNTASRGPSTNAPSTHTISYHCRIAGPG